MSETIRDADFLDRTGRTRIIRLSCQTDKGGFVEELFVSIGVHSECTMIELYRVNNKTKPRRFFFTEDELEALILACNQYVKDMEGA